MEKENHKFCFVRDKRIDSLKRANVPIVKLNYIKQEDKRDIFLSFFQKNGKPMSLNEYVCKKHITQLNKTYKTSHFHEEPENNNHENQENLIVHEDPINNICHSSQNNNSQSQILNQFFD